MGGLEIPKGIKPKEFFERFLPEAFKTSVADMDLSGYKDINFTMEFNIVGPEGGIYGISLINGDRLEVKAGKLNGAMVSIEMSDKVFMDGLSGNIPEFPIEDFLANPRIITTLPPQEAKQRIDDLKNIEGMMEVEAQRGNEKIELNVKFNGADTPSCKLTGDINELMALMKGEMNPVQGFMSGKYKIQGSLPFAMQLQKISV
ncbi:MAG: SCP2 sterol-binding domain-containing protein [Deltaproteobacteria bacterium]|nr:SCP2 sterol-binding domain-containing protein [Deltaproteobacteria bacterium]